MDILLAGSIAYDYLMRFPGKFKDMLIEQSLDKVSLSFLVEEMHKHDGGVSANIAYTMALLGARPRLFGTVGRDFGDYGERLEAVGVDTSTVVVIDEVFTGSFFANTDLENNQIASFYSGAMGHAGDYSIASVTDDMPDLVVISPNDPRAMSNQVEECIEKGIPYLYDPSQQVARLDSTDLKRGIEGCAYLASNEYEWEVIQKHTGLTLDELSGKIFVHTLGEDGANIYSNGDVIHIPTVTPRQIVDPTGAGDAFRAGFLRGISIDAPLDVAGRMGSLAGTYALEFIGTQNHRFTAEAYVSRYREHFDDQGVLDVLLAPQTA
jgi:adenosine kinase